jgi:hypothetical protein
MAKFKNLMYGNVNSGGKKHAYLFWVQRNLSKKEKKNGMVTYVLNMLKIGGIDRGNHGDIYLKNNI